MKLQVFFILFIYILLCPSIEAQSQDWESLLNKADSLVNRNEPDSALDITETVLHQCEKQYGYDNIKVMDILPTYINYLIEVRQYAAAKEELLRGLQIIDKYPSLEDKKVSFLLTLSIVYYYQNELDQAQMTLNQAFDMYKKLFGEEKNKLLGQLFEVQGRINQFQGDFKNTEQNLQEAYNIYKIDSVKNAFNLLKIMGQLARIYDTEAQYDKAESNYKKIMASMERQFSKKPGFYITVLHNYAELSFKIGKMQQADSLYQLTIDLHRRYYKNDDLFFAKVLSSAAYFYMYEDKTEHVEEYFLNAIEIYAKVYGTEDHHVADIENRLGKFYVKMGRYDEAEKLLLHSLKIREKLTSSENQFASHSLNNLGELYLKTGEYTKAETYYLRALKIREKIFGEYHPYVFLVRNSLAKLYSSIGDADKSLEYYKSGNFSHRKFLEYSFATSTENQKLSWVRKYPPLDDSFFSFALREQKEAITNASCNMVLWGKSIVIDAVMREKNIALCSYDDDLLEIFNKRNKLRTTIANIALGKQISGDSGYSRDDLPELLNRQDSLEATLSKKCSEFEKNIARTNIDINKVKTYLNDDAVLCEFVRYDPYDFKENKSEDKERYLVYILSKSDTTVLLDLGDADYIDNLIRKSREMVYTAQNDVYTQNIKNSETALNNIDAKLYETLFKPISAQINNKTELYISPDGMINLLQFAILPDDDGNYLIEHYSINYLSSAQDLLPQNEPENQQDRDAVLFADPDFDKITSASEDQLIHIPSNFAYGPFLGVQQCINTEFSKLRFSRNEAMSIVRILRQKDTLEVYEYYGDDATESQLKAMSEPPVILHIATHGFYCNPEDKGISNDNPLLNSCLALAGANNVINGEHSNYAEDDDGILTAYEVSGLNLMGTELVTLSACESGVGELMYKKGIQGEGVFGLQRAFRHAGAKTILMSLWKTPDKQTAQFMEIFYKKWLEGDSKEKAMRETMLEMMHKTQAEKNSTHPIFWGGFELIGDPH